MSISSVFQFRYQVGERMNNNFYRQSPIQQSCHVYVILQISLTIALVLITLFYPTNEGYHRLFILENIFSIVEHCIEGDKVGVHRTYQKRKTIFL